MNDRQAADQEQQDREYALFLIDRAEWLEWHISCLTGELSEVRAKLKGMYPTKGDH